MKPRRSGTVPVDRAPSAPAAPSASSASSASGTDAQGLPGQAGTRRRGPGRSRVSSGAKKLLRQVVVERVASPVFQIADRLRSMIYDGDLEPGMRLPSTRELSAQFSVDPTSVHRSLSLLVKEGLLLRTPYVGTFVAEPPKKKLERLAFYYRNGGGESPGMFGRVLLEEITRLGHASGFVVEVFSDTRKIADTENSPPDDLDRHTRTRRVQGVVLSSVSPERVRWMDSLPVPFATLSTPRHPHTFSWDRRAQAAAAVHQLAARGCRRIGMLCALLAHDAPGADDYQLGLYRGFVSAMAEAGLEVHPGRLSGIEKPDAPAVDKMPAFGFEAFNRLWGNLPARDRPDGLFIYPDTVALGALMAIPMHNLRVPDDLRLVLHTNAEFPVFCPYPVDRLVVRAQDAARALVGHIRNQLANRATSSRILPAFIAPCAPVSSADHI
ncbi:MAG: GntR family transcriptional regulator [Opitutaceae bacterium]|nr:GntR family transcriptional regulator [Opitutaceae bacterium]